MDEGIGVGRPMVQASRAHGEFWEGALKVAKVTFTWVSTYDRCTCPGGFLLCLPTGWGLLGKAKRRHKYLRVAHPC